MLFQLDEDLHLRVPAAGAPPRRDPGHLSVRAPWSLPAAPPRPAYHLAKTRHDQRRHPIATVLEEDCPPERPCATL